MPQTELTSPADPGGPASAAPPQPLRNLASNTHLAAMCGWLQVRDPPSAAYPVAGSFGWPEGREEPEA